MIVTLILIAEGGGVKIGLNASQQLIDHDIGIDTRLKGDHQVLAGGAARRSTNDRFDTGAVGDRHLVADQANLAGHDRAGDVVEVQRVTGAVGGDGDGHAFDHRAIAGEVGIVAESMLTPTASCT